VEGAGRLSISDEERRAILHQQQAIQRERFRETAEARLLGDGGKRRTLRDAWSAFVNRNEEFTLGEHQ
jgi:hypothetical protein